MTNRNNNGFRFTPYKAPHLTPFERLFDIFKELITHTSGDFDEAIDWLRQLDKEYELTTPDYSIDDFIEELKSKGYVQEVGDVWVITSDEPPSENDFKIEPDKQEGWNLVEAKETGAISDELLEALETSK